LVGSLFALQEGARAAFVSNGPPLLTARSGQTATLLSNGKVLVAGGQTNVDLTTAAAEQYDPATGAWTMTGPMNAGRAHHTATMLPNGQILVAGGYSSGTGALSSAELYDPAAGIWTVTGAMDSPRFFIPRRYCLADKCWFSAEQWTDTRRFRVSRYTTWRLEPGRH
jgi:hypothetical protein